MASQAHVIDHGNQTELKNILSAGCERFENDFSRLIEALPQVVEQKAKDIIAEWDASKDDDLQNVISGYQQLLDDRKRCEEALKEYDRNEPKRHAAFQKARQKVVEGIAKLSVKAGTK